MKCSFCAKTEEQVLVLFAASRAAQAPAICSSCADRCARRVSQLTTEAARQYQAAAHQALHP